MEDGRWEMEDGRWKMGDGRWKMEDWSWEIGVGRWKIEDGRLELGEWEKGVWGFFADFVYSRPPCRMAKSVSSKKKFRVFNVCQ